MDLSVSLIAVLIMLCFLGMLLLLTLRSKRKLLKVGCEPSWLAVCVTTNAAPLQTRFRNKDWLQLPTDSLLNAALCDYAITIRTFFFLIAVFVLFSFVLLCCMHTHLSKCAVGR